MMSWSGTSPATPTRRIGYPRPISRPMIPSMWASRNCHEPPGRPPPREPSGRPDGSTSGLVGSTRWRGQQRRHRHGAGCSPPYILPSSDSPRPIWRSSRAPGTSCRTSSAGGRRRIFPISPYGSASGDASSRTGRISSDWWPRRSCSGRP